MTDHNNWPQQLSAEELAEWRRRFAEANRNNVFCHCRQCHEEWVASGKTACHRVIQIYAVGLDNNNTALDETAGGAGSIAFSGVS